ncbi:hypothetical protein BFJ68_g14242 [Fusarium oxysporum]|uniref:Uncharacterized protein n=2 Tax=Fusarium oxysporum TaxID=5507 RepID=A0A420QHP4_FUSOX|nr:hypothetical protein BFJ65_g13706 [Fusarium oxysporum f. sp. cepae]RKK45124.1 hypothetical protein BFJ66_g9190 [Fusarium oxysporum f. sp. cepae]RKK58090.1 hypothetical protein BFJ67_g3166 [Fusarium oxysporum f. sp. cepae]RKK96821.1 hypothetical protein BFJ68_g14242 [Fusarium oxysporum]RKL04283.1 hypothetical protein BFJ71_g3664 [Fusarium oxysporum]
MLRLAMLRAGGRWLALAWWRKTLGREAATQMKQASRANDIGRRGG